MTAAFDELSAEIEAALNDPPTVAWELAQMYASLLRRSVVELRAMRSVLRRVQSVAEALPNEHLTAPVHNARAQILALCAGVA